ncbi:uncharacterized protein G2W53_021292 [Senna tora]|uniref:Uncharacterized protein n=1 Tax=Senna tora TaxID=362788 RepID=A0A834TJA8_9FABA|nr:uncharacterized protein G2W53_021292 [Senna tora]
MTLSSEVHPRGLFIYSTCESEKRIQLPLGKEQERISTLGAHSPVKCLENITNVHDQSIKTYII